MKKYQIIFIFPYFLIFSFIQNKEVFLLIDFEDGDISAFTKRADWDPTVLTLKKDGEMKGSNYLWVSGRNEFWDGAQISILEYCVIEGRYIASIFVKASEKGKFCILRDTINSLNEHQYKSLKCVEIEANTLVGINDIKFEIPSDTQKAYIYFEIAGKIEYGIDDFKIEVDESKIEENIDSLKDVYKNYFKFGTAAIVDELEPSMSKKLILKHFNSLTVGNELKPDYLLDKDATFEYAQANNNYTNPLVHIGSAKYILDFCEENNIPVRGHVLVWHEQTPLWFFKEKYEESGEWADKDTMIKRLENYIKNVFNIMKENYPKINFYAWDVVNEAWLEFGNHREGGYGDGKSLWVQIFGDNSFIKYAFKFAKKYKMEGCKLFYNDYNEFFEGRRDAIINMTKELNKVERLIDGVGMQAHLSVDFHDFELYEKAIKGYIEAGLEIQVTELDIGANNCTYLGFQNQANFFSKYFDLLTNYSNYITAVIIWGIKDDISWRVDVCPLLFYGNYTAKPCYYSIIDGIENDSDNNNGITHLSLNGILLIILLLDMIPFI